jgi:hypothetical protein
MNISYGVPIMAPQTTGHPAALPDSPATARSDTKVAETARTQTGTDAGLRDDRRENDAPPTAMQRRITELLQEQADTARKE